MWEDKGLYWAWRGSKMPFRTPSTKQITHAEFTNNIKIACGILDIFDEHSVYTPVCREEIDLRISQGWVLKWPIQEARKVKYMKADNELGYIVEY